MLRIAGRLARLLLAFSFLAAIASAIAAVVLKGRLVSRGRPADDEIELVTIFDGQDFTSTASALRRVDLTTLFGGGTLDLRLATLDPAGATVQVRAAFGGYRLAVPATWRVEMRGIGIAGGFTDGRRRDWVDPDHSILTVEGFALFGGIAIVSETPDLGPARPQVTTNPAEAPMATDNRGLVTDVEQVPPSPAAI